MRVYEFAMKLQDMFSPTMQRIASQYEQRTSVMSRLWTRFTGTLRSSTQTISTLRQGLAGLGSGFRVRLDASAIGDAMRGVGRLRDSLGRLWSGSGGSSGGGGTPGSRGGGMGGGFRNALLGGIIGGGISGMAMGAMDMVKSQISEISDKTIGAAQRKQSTMFTLNELMGKKDADGLVKDINRYAPEKRTDLITSAQKLSGAGVAPEKMMATITALNNVASVTNTKVDELAMIQAKIKATGYVQGDEINMFKERGINLSPYLAKTMGVKESDIAKQQAKGAITYDIFDKAMQSYAGKGGRFEGAYERKRDSTTEGKEQMVGARFDAILEGYGAKLLPLKDGFLSMLNDVMSGTGPVVAIFQKLWSTISPVFEGIGGLLQRLGILNKTGGISQGIMDTLSVVWEYFGYVMQVVGGAVWAVSAAIGWLIDSPLAMLIIGIYGATKAWALMNVIMAMNPFALIIIGIAAVVAGVMYAWDKFDGFRNGVLKTWEVIKSVFGSIGGVLAAIFSGDFKAAVTIVGGAITQGIANGQASINSDRLERLNEKRAGRKAREGKAGVVDPFAPVVPGKGTVGDAAGLSSTVGNAKSNNVTINVKSLIEKSEITVMDFQGDIGDLESRLIDALLRVVNSGTRAVTA